MSAINFNASQVQPSTGSPVPVPAGTYTVILVSSGIEPTKNGAGKLIKMRAEVQGGELHGRTISFNLNWENQSQDAVRIGHEQLSAICHAVGVMIPQDTQQLHNIPFSLSVGLTPDEKYNDIKAIEPISQPMQQQDEIPMSNHQPHPQPAQQQPQQPMGNAQFPQQSDTASTAGQPAQQAAPAMTSPSNPQQGQAVPDWLPQG